MIITKSNGTLEINCAYGTDRVRTCDLRRAKAVLSQLSYNPMVALTYRPSHMQATYASTIGSDCLVYNKRYVVVA